MYKRQIYQIAESNRIEKIDSVARIESNRNFFLPELECSSDNVCSVRIGLLSLELHRLHPDLTYCYRIVFDLVCVYTVKILCISSQHEDWVAWWGNGLGDQEVTGSIRDQGVAA